MRECNKTATHTFLAHVSQRNFCTRCKIDWYQQSTTLDLDHLLIHHWHGVHHLLWLKIAHLVID